MKVREILLELSEILDRHASYGAWIDANTRKVHPIKEPYGHMKFINKMRAYNPDMLKIPPSDNGEKAGYLTVAFYNHLVRIVHERSNELNIHGNGEDIQNIARILIASIVQSDMDSVYINKNGVQDNRFALPTQRREAINFINGG
jgi:hypothetical protein